MSVLLHAGADIQTRDQLAALSYPDPLGSRHVVRPFLDDIELIQEGLGRVGYKIVEEAVAVKFNAEGQAAQFFGVIEVEPLSGKTQDDRAICVGVRGSSDQSIPRGLVAGHNIMVCSNLCFTGSLSRVSTKQTLNIGHRIESLIFDALTKLPEEVARDDKRNEAYRNKVLSRRVGDAMLLECVRRGILNGSDLSKAIIEWDTPSHVEHLERGQHTVWTLFSALTQAIQPANPERAHIAGAWNRTLPLIELFDKGVGI